MKIRGIGFLPYIVAIIAVLVRVNLFSFLHSLFYGGFVDSLLIWVANQNLSAH